MARRKKTDTGGGGASWLETYSDMVTLLLTFFIMLYAMSTIDSQKYASIIASISKAMNPAAYQEQMETHKTEEMIDSIDSEDKEEVPDELNMLYTLLKQYVEENELEQQVTVKKAEEYVFIRFSDSITFRGYSDILESSGKEVLDILAEGLTLVDEYIEEVVIAGHTAKVEYDYTDIDRTLSTNRANVVLKYLDDKKVIDPAKYLAIGYGLYSPIADNSTPEGRAKNRRVEIYISRKGYPISYTKKIQETINKTEDGNIVYQRNTYID